jgi:phosphatidylglycerol---prolipoprotein diacylglyceryl transferase
MYRKLFNRVVLGELGPFTFTNYGLNFAFGIVLFLQLFFLVEAHLGVAITSRYAMLVTLSYSVSFALGAKLLRILYNLGQLRRNPRELLRRSGNSFYGGVAGFIAASYLTSTCSGVPFWTQLDITFLCLPMFQIFIRLGCASYGCCFGHPTNGPAAIVYRDAHAPAFLRHGATPLHPSQFYSIIKDVVVLVIVNSLFHVFMTKGLPVALWLMLYPSLRFFVDFTRDPAKKPYYGGLRSSQWISLGLFVVGIAVLLKLPLATYTASRSIALALPVGAWLLPISFLAFALNLVVFGISFVIADRKRAGVGEAAR